jgi:hypothetical protein
MNFAKGSHFSTSLKTLELWDTNPRVSAGAGNVEVRRLSLSRNRLPLARIML